MAKRRNTRYRLTWIKQKRHWRKIYRGKAYTFKPLEGEGQAESYQRCLSEWLAKKAELDAKDAAALRQQNAEYMKPVRTELANKLQGLIDAFGDSDELRFYASRLLELDARAAAIENSPEDLADTVDGIHVNHAEEAAQAILWDSEQIGSVSLDDQLQHAKAAREAMRARQKPPAGRPPWEAPTNVLETLQGAISAWLKVISEEKSKSRLTACTKSLELFTEYLPATVDAVVDALTSDYLSGFAEHIKEKYPNDQTAFQRAQPVQQFTKWCYQRELIDRLPRVIESGSLVARSKPKDKGTFKGIDELKSYLTCDHDTIRTVCLIIANTGLTQGDIAGMRSTDINGNHLTYSRVKTGISRSWLLWDETKHAIESTGLPLLTKTGMMLVEDGKDRFRGLVRNYCEARKLPILKPRRLRAASASLLSRESTYARFAQYWLAHRPTNIADAHYVQPSQDDFDGAVRWLRGQWLS